MHLHPSAVAALAAALGILSFTDAFVSSPSRQAQRQQQRLPFCPNVVIDNTLQLPSTSALNMGLVKDFIVETDAKTRNADNGKYLKELQKRVDTINALEETIEELDDDELQAKTAEFQKRLQEGGEDINGKILEEAFAVVREAAWCVLCCDRKVACYNE